MTDNILLDVAIGVGFALLVFSLIASALQESIAAAFNWRGRTLRGGIDHLVKNSKLSNDVMSHGLISGLHGPANWLVRKWTKGQAKRSPSSIPAESFARSLIETLVYAKAEPKKDKDEGLEIDPCLALEQLKGKIDKIQIDDPLRVKLLVYVQSARRNMAILSDVDGALEAVRKGVDELELDDGTKARLQATVTKVFGHGTVVDEGSVQIALQTLESALAEVNVGEQAMSRMLAVVEDTEAEICRSARQELEELAPELEELQRQIKIRYSQVMDRVVGWYVRRTKVMLLLIGFVLAAVTNFNLIGYAGDLLHDEDMRAATLERAEGAISAGGIESVKLPEGEADTSWVWLQAETDGEEGLSRAEIDQLLSNPELGAIAREAAQSDDEEGISLEEGQAAYARAVKPYDADGDGALSDQEKDAAAAASREQLEALILGATGAIKKELGGAGDSIGWQCEVDVDIAIDAGALASAGAEAKELVGCVKEQSSWTALLSWLIVGLSCTMGGQFWFDFLQNVLRVRTAAKGPNTDQEAAKS